MRSERYITETPVAVCLPRYEVALAKSQVISKAERGLIKRVRQGNELSISDFTGLGYTV